MLYTAPQYKLRAFNCPLCGAFSFQDWRELLFRNDNGSFSTIKDGQLAICEHCDKKSFWLDKLMVAPDATSVPLPSLDMPEEIRHDYTEASSILSRSPRGAAALLRLSIQKLCIVLGERGKNINDDIGELVKKGLPVKIQQSLDILRVVGNNAVHPGQIDLRDSSELTLPLFSLLNMIVDVMISQPKHVNEIYNELPNNLLDAIDKRDKRSET